MGWQEHGHEVYQLIEQGERLDGIGIKFGKSKKTVMTWAKNYAAAEGLSYPPPNAPTRGEKISETKRRSQRARKLVIRRKGDDLDVDILHWSRDVADPTVLWLDLRETVSAAIKQKFPPDPAARHSHAS